MRCLPPARPWTLAAARLSDPWCRTAAGLSRRKDLTLRQDVRLTVGGQQRTLADLFKVGPGAMLALVAQRMVALWRACGRPKFRVRCRRGGLAATPAHPRTHLSTPAAFALPPPCRAR